jgi:hypothetical protein
MVLRQGAETGSGEFVIQRGLPRLLRVALPESEADAPGFSLNNRAIPFIPLGWMLAILVCRQMVFQVGSVISLSFSRALVAA